MRLTWSSQQYEFSGVVEILCVHSQQTATEMVGRMIGDTETNAASVARQIDDLEKAGLLIRHGGEDGSEPYFTLITGQDEIEPYPVPSDPVL